MINNKFIYYCHREVCIEMKLNCICFVVLLALLGIHFSQAMDVCEMDERLLNGFVEIYPQNDSATHSLLDDIVHNGMQVDSGDCSGERLQKLQREASSFLTYNGHLVKTIDFKSMNLEDEDVAALNLLFEYALAKYNSAYAFEKNNETKPKNDSDKLIQVLSELADISYSVLAAEFKNPTPIGVVSNLAANALPSWLYLWIRQDNPFEHNSDYDFGYSWLIVMRDVFLKSFPEGKYNALVNTLVNEASVEKMLQSDRNRLNFHFGMFGMIGKGIFNSAMSDVDESFSLLAQVRVQIYSVLILFHINALFGDNFSWGGLGLMGGYSLIDGDLFGVDIFGGLSYAEKITKRDGEELESTFITFVAGAQIFKRFPVGDMLDIIPNFQWQIEVSPSYYDFVKKRDGKGVMNRFYFGIGFDGKVPMGKPKK